MEVRVLFSALSQVLNERRLSRQFFEWQRSSPILRRNFALAVARSFRPTFLWHVARNKLAQFRESALRVPTHNANNLGYWPKKAVFGRLAFAQAEPDAMQVDFPCRVGIAIAR